MPPWILAPVLDDSGNPTTQSTFSYVLQGQPVSGATPGTPGSVLPVAGGTWTVMTRYEGWDT